MMKVVLVALVAWVGIGCGDDTGSSGGACAGFAGGACDSTELCVFQPGERCGANDVEGTCVKRPTSCAAVDGPPVCGCDGHVYPTACDAHAAGVDTDYDNSCP